jgi:flagella basal body P-ring formation protein FlgA
MLAASLLCLQAIAAIPAGAVPVRGDFAEAPCAGEAARALRYEPRLRAVRAIRDIDAGETIAALPAAMLPDVRPGDTLYLIARVGTATVERAVTAAQPGRRGQALFVRMPDGRIVRAHLSEEPR